MAETSIGLRSVKDAEECLGKLAGIGSRHALEVRSQILVLQKRYEEAAAIAERAMEEVGGPLPAEIAAEAHASIGNLEKARELCDIAANETLRTLDGAWIDRIFCTRARIAFAEKDTAATMDNLEKAWQSAPEGRRPAYRHMIDAVSEGTDPGFQAL